MCPRVSFYNCAFMIATLFLIFTKQGIPLSKKTLSLKQVSLHPQRMHQLSCRCSPGTIGADSGC